MRCTLLIYVSHITVVYQRPCGSRTENNISISNEYLTLDYTLCARLQRHSMSELKEAVRELLQCFIMGLSYKNVYYQ